MTPSEDLPSEVDAAIDALDAPEARRGAVRACLAYLKLEGSAAKVDFVEDVFPVAPAGSDSPDGWWKRTSKHLATVGDRADVVSPPRGRGKRTYQWVGDPVG